MANLLTLRTAGSASILKLDARFFDASVVPLLHRRGFTATASASSPADLHVDVDDLALERLLLGKSLAPASGSISATAAVWEQLLTAASARDQDHGGGARDVGGTAPDAPSTPSKEWIRQPSGKRTKGRTRSKTLKQPTPTKAPSSSSRPVTDPAAFALQNLGRLAELVVQRLRADQTPPGAMVALQAIVVVVEGVAVGRLVAPSPGTTQTTGEGP